MRKVSSVSAGILTGILILGAAGCDKLKSRDDINKGIAEFKNAKYGNAVELFKEAAALDPNNTNATLTSFETSDGHPDDFAQKFTMHLKLKYPIITRPETPAAAPARS